MDSRALPKTAFLSFSTVNEYETGRGNHCMVTLTILNGYRMFTEGYVYWNETNPGDIGLTIVRYIYQQAFQRNEFGMGSAIGVVLLVIVLTVNMFQMNFFGLFKKEDAS